MTFWQIVEEHTFSFVLAIYGIVLGALFTLDELSKWRRRK